MNSTKAELLASGAFPFRIRRLLEIWLDDDERGYWQGRSTVAVSEWLTGAIVGSVLGVATGVLFVHLLLTRQLGHSPIGIGDAAAIPAVIAGFSLYSSSVALVRRKAYYFSTSKTFVIMGAGSPIRAPRQSSDPSFRLTQDNLLDVCFRREEWGKSKIWRSRNCFVATSRDLQDRDPAFRGKNVISGPGSDKKSRILAELGIEPHSEIDGI